MCSKIASAWKYDVFLSFRGEDTRKNFTGHLYSALDQKGIFTFKDNHRLERGKVISSELFKAIEESRFALVVFSENYASSTWCLDELANILECMKAMGQIVLPVFYNVTPSEVRNQTGSFEKAFRDHEKNFREDLEKVQRWRVAMTKIANVSGWHLEDREESEFIQGIVDEISSKLGPTFLNTNGNLVGMESQMKQMDPLLGIGLNDVRMLGICGMGGIGKTTLARSVFDKISYQFDGSSFLANVREVSMTQGLVALQQQLIFEILRERNINISDVHKGSIEIMRRLRHKRVLVILDDADQLEQLQALAGMHDWFGLGSRIIITTRNRHLLVSHGVDNVHMVNGLNHEEAFQLFRWKAFRKGHPTDGYLELSLQMVSYAQRLPLALAVLGSFLFGRSKAEWKDALDRLKEVPDERISEILKISYDGLQELEKKIFLDVACFFERRDKDEVRQILDSCDFHPDIGISVLIDKCMISLSNNILCMHDLIKYMGREIVRQECPTKPGQRSRLWLSNDVYRVLTKNEGTEAVEGIILDFPAYKELKLNAKSFSGMNNLRLLKIKDVSLRQSLEYLSKELRLLNWHGYPLRSLPSNFQHNKLFELNMCYSHIKQLWKGVKHLSQLKIIILSHSTYLTKTPDFTGAPNLERLILDGCTSLSFVHPSIGLLKKLILLNLKDCKQLTSLGGKIEWESLEVLILSGCSKLDKLPADLGRVGSLKILDLGGTAISQPPSSILLLKNLEQLSFHGCKGEPRKFWSSLSSLFPLFSRANPESVGFRLPSSLSGLCSLRHLDLGDCNLQEGAIPSAIGFLPSLIELNLSRNNFVSLPPSISQLRKLETLVIDYCNRLQALPELPASTGRLYAQNCTSLEIISSSPSHIFKSTLRMFHLKNCFKLAVSRRTNGVTVTFFKNVLHSLLKGQLQGLQCRVREPKLEILVPGSHVPDWFIYRSKGASIRTSQPMVRCRGLALCAALSAPFTKLDGKLQVEFNLLRAVSKIPQDKEWTTFSSSLCLSSTAVSKCRTSHEKYRYWRETLLKCRTTEGDLLKKDHLLLFYISTRSLFNNDIFYASAVSFEGSTGVVKECGLCPVYDYDIEEFIRVSNNLSSNTNPEVLDPDRLAVTSTVIKRSRDYCPDQQPYPKKLKLYCLTA